MAPTYLIEKYNQVMKHDNPVILLDSKKLHTYNEWYDRWGFQLPIRYESSEDLTNI